MTSPAEAALRSLGQALGQVLLLTLLLAPGLAKGQQPVVVAERNLVKEILLEHRGQQAASDELVKAHIRLKPGEPFDSTVTDDDIKSKYISYVIWLCQPSVTTRFHPWF